jgi:lysozyme family protein
LKERALEDGVFDIDALIDELIHREGGFVNHPDAKGGLTCFGITEAVARAHGYAGAMRSLPRHEAAAIYRRLYWLRPRFDQVAKRSERIAAELFDTGVNMGPAVATTTSSALSPRSTGMPRTMQI